MKDNIRPDHYRKGEIDLYEAFSKIFPHNEYRAGMQMIALRYMFRDKNDRVEDIDKAMETLNRWKEKEIEYRDKQEKENGNKTLEEAIVDMSKVFGDFTSNSSQNQKDNRNIRLLNSFLDSGYNYLARDENGNLWKYQSIPKRNVSFWNESSFKDTPCKIDGHDFPEVKWTDGEPTRIIDLLETYSKSDVPVCGHDRHTSILLLKMLSDCRFEYVARDGNSELWAYKIKPVKGDVQWVVYEGYNADKIDTGLFPEVKWSDEEPTTIAGLLYIYGNGGENGKVED